MRISFRLNDEHDKELIDKLKSYKQKNLSKILRDVLKENLNYCNDNESKKKEVIKWNFPQKER